MTETASAAPPEGAELPFRSIGELAVRCGHYCWLEHQLFVLTGAWASGPVEGVAVPAGDAPADGEVRVLLSEMSSWHGFLAGQWRDRLPVRAGVDVRELIVPPPGGVAEALQLLEGAQDLAARLDGLVEPVLTGLLAAYDDEVALASPVSERPVLGLLELARPHARREIETGRELVKRRAEATPDGVSMSEWRDRLQLLLTAPGGIVPAAWAS